MSSHDDEHVSVPRETLDAITEMIAGGHEHDERLRAAAYQQGQAGRRRADYETGFTIGHDTGLSARQDTRGCVHGILDDLLRRDRARHMASRQPDREAEAS